MNGQSPDGAFPFTVSPTASVYAPKSSTARSVSCVPNADAVVDRVAVVKATTSAANVRVVVPVFVADVGDDDGCDDASDGAVLEESSDVLFEARLRAAMEAEANGVDLSSMFAAKRGVANSPVGAAKTTTTATTQDTDVVHEDDDEDDDEKNANAGVSELCASSPVKEDAMAPPSPVAPTAVVEPESDAFERMLAKALDDASGVDRSMTTMTTEGVDTSVKDDAVAMRPFEEAMPKREFKPKFDERSPEKYEAAPKPEHSTSALDFEAKLEAAMRAAELGGDLTAILSGPSSKVMNSPPGADAQSRVNFRELGISKSELKHHELHVADSDVALK